MTCYRFDNDSHVQRVVYVFKLLVHALQELRDWCMFACCDIVVHAHYDSRRTLLIRDCGTRTYALQFTNGQNLQRVRLLHGCWRVVVRCNPCCTVFPSTSLLPPYITCYTFRQTTPTNPDYCDTCYFTAVRYVFRE